MKTNTLIFGPIGAGKSYSTRTLLAEYPDHEGKVRKGVGQTVLFHACEPGWEAVNGDLACDMGFHIQETLPADPDYATSLQWLETIQGIGTDDLIRKSMPGSILRDYRQFMDLYRTAINFTCMRCEQEFGNLENLDKDCNTTYVNDGLTGISKMAVQFIAGPKPNMSLPEYGRAQHHVEGWVNKQCTLNCSYVLIAHWAREPDPVEGGTNITIHTVGQKLAPRLLLDTFDEVILAERKGHPPVYTWNLADDRVDQKGRRLEYRAGLRPDFTQIFRNS